MEGAIPCPVTPDQVGAYRFRIRNPVIASGAKQSRAVCAHSGLLRSARYDEARRLADAKGKIADQVRGDDEIGRAACRVRVCTYVKHPVVGVSFKRKIHIITRRLTITS